MRGHDHTPQGAGNGGVSCNQRGTRTPYGRAKLVHSQQFARGAGRSSRRSSERGARREDRSARVSGSALWRYVGASAPWTKPTSKNDGRRTRNRGPESETISRLPPASCGPPPLARATELQVEPFRRVQTMKTLPSTWHERRRCWVDKLHESEKSAALNKSDSVLASDVQALAPKWISMTSRRQNLLLVHCISSKKGGRLCPLQRMRRRC